MVLIWLQDKEPTKLQDKLTNTPIEQSIQGLRFACTGCTSQFPKSCQAAQMREQPKYRNTE